MKTFSPLRSWALWLLLCLLVFTHPAVAQDKAVPIDTLLTTHHTVGQFNGVALVAEKAKVIFNKGYGEASLEWNLPNMPDTKFRRVYDGFLPPHRRPSHHHPDGQYAGQSGCTRPGHRQHPLRRAGFRP